MPQLNPNTRNDDVLFSLDELHKLGKDPAAEPSCAVPNDKQGIKGCKYADRCIFRHPENGGFGPRTVVPGTGGQGPENVAVYHESRSSGTAREKFMPCSSFMSGLIDDYRQQEETGDKIIVLGGPGTVINDEYLMPEDPASNKTGNSKMKLVEKQMPVPSFREWRDNLNTHHRRDQIMRMQEKRRQLNNQRRLEEVGLSEPEPAGEVVAEPVAADRKRGGRA